MFGKPAHRWGDASPQLSEQVSEVRELEAAITAGRRSLSEAQARLHELYAITFKAFELKGIVEASGGPPGPTSERRRSTEADGATS